jgi:hypothetical protein
MPQRHARKLLTRPFTSTDGGPRLKAVADTDAIYDITGFVKDHAVVILIVGSLWFICCCESPGRDNVMLPLRYRHLKT